MEESSRRISPSISVKADERLETGEASASMKGATGDPRGVFGFSCFRANSVGVDSLGTGRFEVPVGVHDMSTQGETG